MNKLCVITGATSGIGREAARQLVRRGFDLAVIGRSAEKGEELKRELKRIAPDAGVYYYVADMADIRDVKRVSAQVVAQHPVIDVLINNAGGIFASFELTADGIERTIANNHIGYYVSTLMLLDALKKSEDGRIIIVSSASHYRGKLDVKSFTSPDGYSIMKAYEQSKLANVLFAYKLAGLLENSGISVFCLHPGVVKTDIGNKTGSKLYTYIWKLFIRLVGITTEKSAETYVYLSTDPQASQHRGEYFHAGKPRKSSEISYDKKVQDELWTWSERVTGVGFNREP